MKQLRGTLLLLLASLIWGTTFVAQSEGMNSIGPFAFNATRSFIGGSALVIFVLIRDMIDKKRGKYIKPSKADNKKLCMGAVWCGVCLSVASAFQQTGMIYTTVGKAGFVTTMYIILVPIFGLIFGKKISFKLVVSVILSVVGLYLLCMTERFIPEYGDLLVFFSAISFAVHIMVIDHYTDAGVDCVKMACGQFFVCGILSLIMMFIFEDVTLAGLKDAMFSVMYAGLLSSGVAYTLQIVAQKDLNPTLASLIMSLESVVAVLSGWLIMNEIMSNKEITGCVIMFLAIILAQLPEKKKLS